MEKRESITLLFCEKCGEKVSSRDESCSGCGTLPFQWDRNFYDEFEISESEFYE
jgi:predicted amidophosphoribosyltransferase